jgi:hypothetical protein
MVNRVDDHGFRSMETSIEEITKIEPYDPREQAQKDAISPTCVASVWRGTAERLVGPVRPLRRLTPEISGCCFGLPTSRRDRN